jgi:hypothetical protein
MTSTKGIVIKLLVGSSMVVGLASNAFATLTTFYSLSGTIGLSTDGGGSYQSTLPNGINADVPAGSQVVAAYLFTSTFGTTGSSAGDPTNPSLAGGTLNGTTVTYTSLIPNPDESGLQAGVTDVTSIVAAAINPGGVNATGGVYNFAVTESDTSNQDGEILDVIYSNPSLPTTSIGILAGGSASAGDTSAINFGSSPAGLTVLMSVGDGFSYDLGGSGQQSTITVDGSLLTSAAGNCDLSQDGGTPPNPTVCTDGDLITDGVLGLNADGSVDTAFSNPFTPIGDTVVQTDHELYNISSLIDPSAGDTISLTTTNSSFDDNIFTEAFVVDGVAGFNAPPPPPDGGPVVPEPSTLSLLGLGMSSLGMLIRRRRAA